VAVLEDPFNVTLEDDSKHETRFITLGASTNGNVLYVVWTERSGDVVRIISARRASPGEARNYQG